MFESIADQSEAEELDRMTASQHRIKVGINFLDDAMGGIAPNDLILIGAGSGLGKTQLMCNIALHVLAEGKRVHYIALEADRYEIGRRIKYMHFAEMFYSDPDRPMPHCSYEKWDHLNDPRLQKYNDYATNYCKQAYPSLHVYYKQGKFDYVSLIETVLFCAPDTDLIIVDHVHYFDYDDDNENRAIKQIAKTARDLCIDNGKPMILVSHMRKRDRYDDQLVPGLEDFHGSSDLYKIATKVVTMSAGLPTDDGRFATYFAMPKNRTNGGVTRYMAKLLFNPRKGNYEKSYQLGYSGQKRGGEFEVLSGDSLPEWASRATGNGSFDSKPPERISGLVSKPFRKKPIKNFYEPS